MQPHLDKYFHVQFRALAFSCRMQKCFHFSQVLFESSAGLQNKLGITLLEVGFAPSCESGEQPIFHLPMRPIFYQMSFFCFPRVSAKRKIN